MKNLAKALEVLNTPPVVWEDEIKALSPDDRVDLVTDLADLMERCATLRGYVEGCHLYGERPHTFGVKAANKLRARIRAVLGYAYPESGSIQF